MIVDWAPTVRDQRRTDSLTLRMGARVAGMDDAVNPGPVDNGWMTGEIRDGLMRATSLGRLGTLQDCATLVRFLCSPEGGWVGGQVLKSNGGIN